MLQVMQSLYLVTIKQLSSLFIFHTIETRKSVYNRFHTEMDRWIGKIALVTGASAGIGASITEELAKAGVKVFGLARRAEKIEELKKKVGSVKGEIIPLKGDVSKESDILAAFKTIKDKFGKIHILVNNAGIGRFGLLSEADPKLFREVFDTNVMGLTICTQQALKLMKESGVDDGHIIHINSIAGHYVPNTGTPTFNVYAASKYAVTALTESLRQELVFLKSKIRITSISPGYVETEIMAASMMASGITPDQLPKESADFMKEAPALKAKDIADSVLYVLSTPPHVQVHELTIKPVGEKF